MIITREPEYIDPDVGFIRGLGRGLILFCRELGRAVLITLRAMWYLPLMFSRRNRLEVIYNLFATGIKTLSVTTVVALFTGMIFALQTGLALRNYGQEVYVGAGVTVTMLREMGPFMTALIIAASVGSAIAAQIGTMTVSEEVAALEIMSIDPVRFLVMPRLVALMVMTPLLSFYTDILAILGGSIVANTQLGVSFRAYLDNAYEGAFNKDLWVGLFKALVFGIIICTVACYQGFSTREGAVGVGRATRATVVNSFLTILIVGFIISKLFYGND
jgi:phospholipid/cholesterol/gamma-HCH transport system permease protein